MKTQKENKNDEGFKEKTEVAGLGNWSADMAGSNQIGWVYVCILGLQNVDRRKERRQVAGEF